MFKVRNLGDNRNKGFCVHCGGPFETIDHNPSRVFLDEPLPPDLPTNPSCMDCNNGFSADEAYVACGVECAVTGALDPDEVGRPKISALLRRDNGMLAAMRQARRLQGSRLLWSMDIARVERVLVKLARGHAAFEVNEPQVGVPSYVGMVPLHLLDEPARQAFETVAYGAGVWPEVGSRAMMRALDLEAPFAWQVVQPGRYRYRVTQGGSLKVSVVIRDYLAAEVVWD